ncbi:MAG: hypothetical protein MK135_03310 [Polyangiaceae bacterium]|nr:hypothetical protein [Polyangiaceae bacterium]
MARPAFSLRFAIISLLLVCLIPISVGLAVSSFLNGRATVEMMWADLADELVDDASEKTLRYFEPGPTQLTLHRQLVEDGDLNLEDSRAILRTLSRCIRSQPNITWCSFASVDGRYYAAHRMQDSSLQLSERVPEGGRTKIRTYALSVSGQQSFLKEEYDDYDPRLRDWWQVGLEAESPTWAKPFLFVTRGQPGVVLTLRQDSQEGQPAGVWLAEYELSYVSQFLQNMKERAKERKGVLAAASVTILSKEGFVLGHPERSHEKVLLERKKLNSAAEHPNHQVRRAYNAALSKGGLGQRHHLTLNSDSTQPFDSDVTVAVIAPFPAGGPSWSTLVTIPQDSLLGQVYAANRRAAFVAGIFALLAVIIGIYLANRFVRPVAAVAQDLDKIAHLEFPERQIDEKSLVAEVRDMLAARNRMTGALRSFIKYVPATLVRHLLAAGGEAELGGKTQELTVYFSDIVGFTSLAEKLTPQELVDFLGEYLSEMSDIVESELGTVDKYIGDAIMAFWGAPFDVDDPALKGVLAALKCQTRLAELRDKWSQSGRPVIHARIGLNTGECLVGNIGSSTRMNYTVMGDPVNVASRLEAQCKTYGVAILIGGRTQELISETVLSRPIDKIAVKGKDEGIIVYEPLAPFQDASAGQKQLAQQMTSAFELYLLGDFSAARAGFESLLQTYPEDKPARLLHDRCRDYQEKPPEPWDGVLRLTTK